MFEDMKIWQANVIVYVSKANKNLRVLKNRYDLQTLLDDLWMRFPGYTIEAFGILYAQEERKLT